MSLSNACRLTALCKANSAVLSQQIGVIDALLNRVHSDGAKQIYRTACPVIGSSVGQHFRHSLDHMERCALDGLQTVRDNAKLIDLHYDVRERGTLIETDPFEARDRLLFVSDTFDGVCSYCEQEGGDACKLDASKNLTAYFMIAHGDMDDPQEYPLASTLERELGFVYHHAIHHNALVRNIAAVGKTGLVLDDLPPNFGRAPGTIYNDLRQKAA